MEIYTNEQWEKDRTFKAVAGQEVTEEIYLHMLNCMPPKNIPKSKAEQALHDYRIPVHAGFLMGEPHDTNSSGEELYLAFGMYDFGSGLKREPRYFYLGLSIAEKELTGEYYYFDCMNAEVNKLFEVSAFENDKEAIATAANYEATLYRYKYIDGERISSKVLYEPCF